MKKRTKTIFIAFFVAAMMCITVFAAPLVKNVSISYNDIKITLNGKQITPKDANGNAVEPFILDGSTYLPVRAVGEALGLDVDWDGNTNTVILNDKKAETPAPKPETATKETKKFEGRLDKEDSVETYDFTLPYASRIIFDFEHKFLDSNTEYWNIQFISKKYDEKILEFDSKGNIVKTSTNDTALYLPAGEYYVKVAKKWSWSHSNLDYTITINYEKNIGQFETENNDTMETANQIYLDKPITGNLLTEKDEDYFKFTVDKKGDIVIYFEHNFIDSNSEYWDIQLFEKNTTKKLEFDIKGNKVTTSSEKINLEPGEYYIRVVKKWSWSHSSIDYTLTVKTQ